MLFSVAMCGFWIRAKGITDAGAVDFHMKMGVATVIGGVVGVALLIVLAVKR